MKNEVFHLKMFSIPTKRPKRHRQWMYQLPNEKPREIIKDGKWWHYQTQAGSVGCDTLDGAKSDLKYLGAKVWSELINC